MSKQLHKLQEFKKHLFLTHDEMILHKLKRHMLDFYVIYRLGHTPKDSKLANSPVDTKTKNVDKSFQKKKTITKNVDWSSDDYFQLFKAAIDA